MPRHWRYPILAVLGLLIAGAGLKPAASREAAKPAAERVREIFVPYEDLHVLLENQPRRVLLSRKEFEELLAKAKKTPKTAAPRAAVLVSADYTASTSPQRARLTGTLTLDILEDGLHAVPLDLAGVGLGSATLDGAGAAIGRADDGRLTLLAQGKGRHKLVLEMVAPLQTTAAEQVLNFRLPKTPAARIRLTVPGNVEVKSGAEVASRTFDEAAGVTRLEILPRSGDVSLVMTLNSRLQRRQRVVAARSVLVDEVTEAYERLHATVSLAVLHRAVDGFRFLVPEGFEITEVSSPLLAHWAVASEGPRRILEVRLRRQTTETVVLNLMAVRKRAQLGDWKLPKLEPLEVAGHVAVVGLLVEERLKAESIAAAGLIPIDTGVLRQALPETVFQAAPGAAALRPVVAYYAPQTKFSLAGRFARPPAQVAATCNLLLLLGEREQEVRGVLVLEPEVEKLFAVEFSAPPLWLVTSVTAADEKPLKFESYGKQGAAGRVRVHLASGVPPGEQLTLYFRARCAPAGWLVGQKPSTVEFPAFVVLGATRDEGAIAVAGQDDVDVHPKTLDKLAPLDESEKARYGLAGVATDLAYRYQSQPYKMTLAAELRRPRLTARTFSFLRIGREALAARYEIIYDVAEARTRQLSFLLPQDTPADLLIRGLDGVNLKQYLSEPAEGLRRWRVLLEEPRQGRVRLAIDFSRPLAEQQPKDLVLPLVRAAGVAYQSGLVAVEGSAELDVKVKTTAARRVDVGELADAEYQPGRRLLGAFALADEAAEAKIDVLRHEGYRLHPVLVQKATLSTHLSASGRSQTQADFQLRTKAMYLKVELPQASTLWSASLDGRPIKPQREGESLLVSLPAAGGAARALRIVYETPARAVDLSGNVELLAPKLLLHTAGDDERVEVPLADLQWHLRTPGGYQVAASEGTVVTNQLQPLEPAAVTLAKTLYRWAGGSPGPFLMLAASHSGSDNTLKQMGMALHNYHDAHKKFPPIVYPDTEHWQRLEGRRGSRRGAVRQYGGAAMVPKTPRAAAEGQKRELGDLKWRLGKPGPGMAGPGPGARPAEQSAPPPAGPPTRGMAGDPFQAGRGRQPADQGAGMPGAASQAGRGRRPAGGMGGMGAMGAGPPRPPALQPQAASPQQAEAEALAGAVNGRAEAAKAAQPVADLAPSTKPPALAGVRSLDITLADQPNGEPDGQQRRAITFHSLGGGQPRVVVTLANRVRFDALGWGLALAVGLVGLALSGRAARAKLRLIVFVAVAATLLPLVPGLVNTAGACNMAFYAAALLVPYYLAAWLANWLLARARRVLAAIRPKASAAAVVFLAVAAAAQAAAPPAKQAPPQPAKPSPYVIQVVEPPRPVKVPEDAIILPYDPDSKTGIRDADRRLVPYAKYVELWNRAYPDRRIDTARLPANYALAGASYTARLVDGEYLLIEGWVDFELFTDQYVTVPLGLGGGVLARAELDSKPARVTVALAGQNTAGPVPQSAQPQPAAQQVQQRAPQQQVQQQERAPGKPPAAVILLHAAGKGRHRLELAVRLRLERRGGWRAADGVLPAAVATALVITVPQPQTELRLDHLADRRKYETDKPDTKIETALGPDGRIGIQWRPKVADGQGDRSLTVRSDAVLDVQEDGLRVVWHLDFEFRRSRRESFSVSLPAEYLVTKVVGTNVRGWEVRREDKQQTVEVSLLSQAREREGFAIHLWRRGPVGQGPLVRFQAPVVTVGDAALHEGRLCIRRSAMLDLRTEGTSGVTRSDLPAKTIADGSEDEQSPLGIRPFQAYRFVGVPFSVRLAAAPLAANVTAEVQTLLKIAEDRRGLESRIKLAVKDRPVYRVEVLVPEDLELDDVSAPGQFQWALTQRDKRPLLTVYLAAAAEGDVPIVLLGKLGGKETAGGLALPRLEVLGVRSQQGDIAVQVDPAFEVRADQLLNCRRVLALGQLYGWLGHEQRRTVRLALHYDRPDYTGTLKLSPRKAVVNSTAITNVKLTDRIIEETIRLDLVVQDAGIREFSFLLPGWMADSRIRVPGLRSKTIEPVNDKQGAPVRVRIELQEEMMGQLGVVVENDRLLGGQTHIAPIPTLETGRTQRRFVVLESAGRDELVVEEIRGLEELVRQQREWRTLAGILGQGITRAYLVSAGAKEPRLRFSAKSREAVQTAGARIGLAETDLVVDASGAYRAAQVYHLDNSTEQYLRIELPPGARLWTARVAGEPVKPTEDPAAPGPGNVRIPLVKTAAGDLDYQVVLKYGGVMRTPRYFRPVRFPLMHTLNIEVELSQVRLHLPRTSRWFDFDGTMRQVGSRDDLIAGLLSYHTKKARGLLETFRHGGKFAKVRAADNIKQMQEALGDYHETFGDVTRQTVRGSGQSEALAKELFSNAAVLEEAEEELQERQKQPPAAQQEDNRYRLNEQFREQKTSRARNVVTELGRNFDAQMGQKPAAEAKPAESFNPRWLDENQLSNPVQPPERQKGKGKDKAGKADGKSRVQFDRPQMTAPARSQTQPGKQLKAKAQFTQSQLSSVQRPSKADSQGGQQAGDAVTRYKRRLAQQRGQKPQDRAGRILERSDVLSAAEYGGAQEAAEKALEGELRSRLPRRGYTAYAGRDTSFGLAAADVFSADLDIDEAGLPGGLASLDVELPDHPDFYQQYLFTTPRGEVKITARAASEKLIAAWLRIGVLIGVVLLGALALRLAHGGTLAWLGTRRGSTVLVVVGIAGLIFGVLPVAAAVALAAGMAIKLCRLIAKFARRHRPAAAEALSG